MNVLDENITVVERQRLRLWRIHVRHIGHDIGRSGMDDEEIIPFLLTLHFPTLFTEDWDYFNPRLCHPKYCLVHLDVRRDDVAVFARRFLKHTDFDTQAKRMGAVVRVSQIGLVVWRLHASQESRLKWSG
jgi:hypothetical protein